MIYIKVPIQTCITCLYLLNFKVVSTDFLNLHISMIICAKFHASFRKCTIFVLTALTIYGIGAGKLSNPKVVSSSSHEIMVEDAAGLDYIDKVAKRAVEIIFHAEWEKSVLKSVSNRMNSWYSRN